MTAQIAVMNKKAVALASDSANTLIMSNRKKRVMLTFDSEKIIPLKKPHTLAVMLYGHMKVFGKDWHSMIRRYLRNVPKRRKKYVEDYCETFILFLEKNIRFFPMKKQQDYFKELCEKILEVVSKKQRWDYLDRKRQRGTHFTKRTAKTH